jgi:putative endonuclease
LGDPSTHFAVPIAIGTARLVGKTIPLYYKCGAFESQFVRWFSSASVNKRMLFLIIYVRITGYWILTNMDRMSKIYHVYIMTNRYHTVFYTGMTGRNLKRTFEHKSMLIPGFTSNYKITKLVHWEAYAYVQDAIAREKQIKRWSRAKKIALINKYNPDWKDLYDEMVSRKL